MYPDYDQRCPAGAVVRARDELGPLGAPIEVMKLPPGAALP